MARENITTKSRRDSSKAKAKPAKTIRASERHGISVDAKTPSLRDLMTEQSRNDSGYSTYYTCTAAQLVNAGVPAKLIPAGGRKKKFVANGRDAFIRRIGDLFELELTWGAEGPWYHGANHPALSEIARMIHIDVGYWMQCDDYYKYILSDQAKVDEVPVKKLCDSSQASDYRIPPGKKFRFSKNFYIDVVAPIIDRACYAIQMAEIMPLTVAAGVPEKSGGGNVVALKRKPAR